MLPDMQNWCVRDDLQCSQSLLMLKGLQLADGQRLNGCYDLG